LSGCLADESPAQPDVETVEGDTAGAVDTAPRDTVVLQLLHYSDLDLGAFPTTTVADCGFAATSLVIWGRSWPVDPWTP